MSAHGLTTWVRLGAVIGLASFAACGEKGFGNVSKEDAPETVADTLCDQADACGCFEGMQITVDLCKMQYESQWQMLIDAAEAAGLIYDGNCVGRMLDAYHSLGCKTAFDEGDVDDFDECSQCKFFYGTKNAGEPCMEPDESLLFLGDECKQGLYCDGEVCVDPCETAGEGQSCINASCAEGLDCQYTYDPETGEESAVCVRPVGEGEDCLEASCAEDLWCQHSYDPETGSETATCVRPAGEGEDCTELPCGLDLQCDYETYTCVPSPSDPGPGEPCPNGYCQDGAYCDTNDPDPMNWVCVAQKGDNEPCQDDQECVTYECNDGACAPEQPIVCWF